MLNRFEFTDETVAAATLPPGKNEAYFYDTKDEGLMLRIRASGAKSFLFGYMKPGVRAMQRNTIGPFPRFKVKHARTAVDVRRGEVATGRYPNEIKRAEKKVAKAKADIITFGSLIEPPNGAEEEHCPTPMTNIDYKARRILIDAIKKLAVPDGPHGRMLCPLCGCGYYEHGLHLHLMGSGKMHCSVLDAASRAHVHEADKLREWNESLDRQRAFRRKAKRSSNA